MVRQRNTGIFRVVSFWRSALCLLLAAATLCSFAGCTVTAGAEELSKGYMRKALDEGEIHEAYIQAAADFSLSLFKNALPDGTDNYLLSPFSALLCFTLIANGADGSTKEEIERCLGMTVEDLNKALYAHVGSLSKEDCKLFIANSIWIQENLPVKETFLQTGADWYDAQVFSAPFDESTVKDINRWTQKQTGGMIDKMIDEISKDTVMYLINTLYFDSSWADKYEKSQIRDSVFTAYDGQKDTVKMMYSTENSYLRDGQAQGFMKKYKDNYAFVGLLPEEGSDIYEYAASLDGAGWLQLLGSERSDSVSVGIPRFSYDAKTDIKDALEKMGISQMFDGGADFSQMSDDSLCCGGMFQKAKIELNENGTKATAVTWGEMTKGEGFADEIQIILNRPFLYAIVDTNTGLPLFIGIVSTL